MTNVTISGFQRSRQQARQLQQNSAAQISTDFQSSELNDLETKAAAGSQVIAGFFLASANSGIDMTTVTMEGTQGSVGSAIYVQIGCKLDLKDSQLSDIGDSDSGPVVKGESADSLVISNSVFSNN